MHLATYREAEDLLDKLAFYLGREMLREKIAAAGRAEALEKHTYRHRMERVLQEAEAALARIVVPVTAVRANSRSPGWDSFVQPGADAGTGGAATRSQLPSPGWGGIVQPGVSTPGTTGEPHPRFLRALEGRHRVTPAQRDVAPPGL